MKATTTISTLIEHGNDIAIQAARKLGVPLARVQKLILSQEWRKSHKASAEKRAKLLEGAK
jgi:hypothetical protein